MWRTGCKWRTGWRTGVYGGLGGGLGCIWRTGVYIEDWVEDRKTGCMRNIMSMWRTGCMIDVMRECLTVEDWVYEGCCEG
jgi:hypothetical protein